MEIETLRADIHTEVDRLLDQFIRELRPSQPGELLIQREEPDPATPWRYVWPNGDREPYGQALWYRLWNDQDTMRVVLGRGVRGAFNKADRGRLTVFRQIGSDDSGTFYPWLEFAETDDAQYAAVIPDPRNPRSRLREGDQLPPELDPARVHRTDELFSSVFDGPSLRYVFDPDADEEMLRYSFWVAALRGRVNG